ncbi:MAG: PKD domain-containing protein [Bacteroidota bacterium]
MKRISTIRPYLLALGVLIGQFAPLFSQACIDTFPYLEDFEASNGGWTTSAILPGQSSANSWEWNTPNNPVINSAASGTNCWLTSTNAFVLPPLVPYAYFPNEYSQVISPCYDFTNLQNPGIQVSVFWESEFSVDGTVLQSSIDGGTTWQRIGSDGDQVAWYNDNGISGGISGPGGQSHGWTGTLAGGTGSAGWVSSQHALDGLAGQPNVLLRFAFASDASGGSNSLYNGFAFDDVFIADMANVDLGPDTTICFADTVFMDACVPSGLSYSWNTNPVTDTFCNKIALSTGQFIVTVIDTNNFIIIDTLNLVVSPTNVILPPDQLICPGDTISIDAANPQANHLWLPDSSTNQAIDVWETGTYTVIVSDNAGCVEVDSIQVFVEFVPDVNLGPDTTICQGEAIVLDAGDSNPGTTYSWTPFPAITQTIFVSSPGNYAVVLTTPAGCLATDSVIVEVSLDPVVDLGPDRQECGMFFLDANNPGQSYIWSNGDTTQGVFFDQGGWYWVEVTNQFGCFTRDSVFITQVSDPMVDLGADDVICNGEPVLLDAGNPGASYLWSNADTTQTISVMTPGTYTVLVTNGLGCTSSDTVQISISTLQVDLGDDATICEGDSLLLDGGTTAATYNWSTGEQTQFIYGFDGAYSVTVSDGINCEITEEIFLSTQTNFVTDFSTSGPLQLFSAIQFTDQSNGTPTGWMWDFGDGTTSTDENPSHIFQSVGVFEVCLTVNDDICTNTYCEEIQIDIFDSVEELFGLEWKVFPNPGNHSTTLSYELLSPEEIEIRLLDLSGKLLYQAPLGRTAQGQHQLDLLSWSHGMYLIELQVAGLSVYEKLLIE